MRDKLLVRQSRWLCRHVLWAHTHQFLAPSMAQPHLVLRYCRLFVPKHDFLLKMRLGSMEGNWVVEGRGDWEHSLCGVEGTDCTGER